MYRRPTPAFSAATLAAAFLTMLGVAPAAAQPAGTSGDVDWTGPYAGVQFGRSIADPGNGNDGIGSAAGVQAGCRHDFGSFILGGEVQYDWTHLDVGDGEGSVDGLGLKLDAGCGTGLSQAPQRYPCRKATPQPPVWPRRPRPHDTGELWREHSPDVISSLRGVRATVRRTARVPTAGPA